MTPGRLGGMRVQNFKAIRDSRSVKLTPLTALIGNNGSGKSSLIEALETYQTIVTQGLDAAMHRWRGFENVRNNAVPHDQDKRQLQRIRQRNPISFTLKYRSPGQLLTSEMVVNSSPNGDELFIQGELLQIGRTVHVSRDERANFEHLSDMIQPNLQDLSDGTSMLTNLNTSEAAIGEFVVSIPRWQFLLLNPDDMGSPRPRNRTGGEIRLARDGSNVAEYLLDISRRDPKVLADILETVQYVMPYVKDLQPSLTSELERLVYLQISEADFKVPGWLLSSGTMRVLALIALMRHPSPPPLIVVEEIENGLDPRTIAMLVEEMRILVESGRSQIILTTHSPYLLDLLALEHIVLVERIDGQSVFRRPADQAGLKNWVREFGPGQLYTMGRLQGDHA